MNGLHSANLEMINIRSYLSIVLIIIIAGMWNLRRVFSEITIICRWLNISGNTKVQIIESM